MFKLFFIAIIATLLLQGCIPMLMGMGPMMSNQNGKCGGMMNMSKKENMKCSGSTD